MDDYDPKCSGGFGGVDRLYKDVKKEGKFNINYTKIKEWMMKQDAYTLHKPIRRHFKRNQVIVGGIDQQWQMDLADMAVHKKFNYGYRYLLVCIDVFSKYAWVVPLKNKKGPSLVEAFKIILSSGHKPEKIITDQGTEFFNKHFKALLKDEDIELYNMYNETKASVVEHLICILKTRMWRYFTAKKTMRYIDMLPDLVYSYKIERKSQCGRIAWYHIHLCLLQYCSTANRWEHNGSFTKNHSCQRKLGRCHYENVY